MAEQVDVLIAGTGFGGSIAAWRLAELYHAAGVDPKAIVMLERGQRLGHTDFKQSMAITNLSKIYNLTQGDGMQVVTANAVGGGSNLYLAASIRSPSETFERRDRKPGDGPERRMWPTPISRRTLNPFYARVEQGLRVERPTWDQVSKSGGLWAATLAASGHTCDRVPLAISEERCVNAKWCHTGCIFGAKNSLITNYLAAAEGLGVVVKPGVEVQNVKPGPGGGYRWTVVTGSGDYDAKVVILATGAMGDSPILMRSANDLPSLSSQVGLNVGSNGDHIAAAEYDPKKIRSVLGLPGYGQFYKGKPITTMSYDWWVGRRDHRYDGTRFTLQEIFLSSLTNFLYDDGRKPEGDPSWWGLQKKHSVSTWNNHIELLAMVEETNDGAFYAVPPSGDSTKPNDGPVTVGLFSYKLSEQSIAVREAANAAMKKVLERRGLARFMKLTETAGAYCSHPLGGCRMAESADLGVVDANGAVFGYEGLYCFGSSIIPTSLGVNPSLTIAAVAERNAIALAARGDDFGLPKAPAGLRHRVPPQTIGKRVIP